MREQCVRRHGEDVYTQKYIKGPQRITVTWTPKDGGDTKTEKFRSLSNASHGLLGLIDGFGDTEGDRQDLLRTLLRISDGEKQSGLEVKVDEHKSDAHRYESHVFEKTDTIKDFVYDTVRREYDPDMYRFMRRRRTTRRPSSTGSASPRSSTSRT